MSAIHSHPTSGPGAPDATAAPPAETAAPVRYRPAGLAPAAATPPTAPPAPPPAQTAPDDGPTIVAAALARPRVLLIGTAIGAVLGVLWVLLNWNSYTMSARIALRDPWEADLATTDRPVGGDYERFVRSQARFAGSDAVLADAADSLGISVQELRDSVSVMAGPGGDVLMVTSQASQPAESERRLNGLVDAYARQRSLVVQQLAKDAIAGIEAELAGPNANNGELQNRASQLRIAVAAYGTGIAFVERDPIRAALSPTMKVAFPIAGAIVGLGGAVLAAWVLADRRPRLADPATAAARAGLPYLGAMPAPDGLHPDDRRGRVACDAVLLALANQLRGREPRQGGRTYCVVLAAGDESVDVGTIGRLLVTAATDNGARAATLDVAAVLSQSGGAGSAAGLDLRVQAQQAADRDLLLFACPSPALDVSALRLGLEADATVVVGALGGDARQLADALAAFDRAGLRPAGLLALEPNHGGFR